MSRVAHALVDAGSDPGDQSFQSGRIKSEQVSSSAPHIRAKSVTCLAFDVNGADHGISGLIEHWDNDLRPYNAKRPEVTGI